MNQDTRNTLNILINNIKISERNLTRFEKADTDLTPAQWDQKRDRLVDSLNDEVSTFLSRADSIWYCNFDKGVQKSVNYYLKKAGFKTKAITAYM